MTKTKPKIDLIKEIYDLIKKQLILDLFILDVSQEDMAKKLKTDIHTVNNFLKGIKKK